MTKEPKLFKKTTSLLALSLLVVIFSVVGAFLIRQTESFQDPTTTPTTPGNQSSAAADQADLNAIQSDLNLIKNKAGTTGYDRTTDSLEALREKLNGTVGTSNYPRFSAPTSQAWGSLTATGNGYAVLGLRVRGLTAECGGGSVRWGNSQSDYTEMPNTGTTFIPFTIPWYKPAGGTFWYIMVGVLGCNVNLLYVPVD